MAPSRDGLKQEDHSHMTQRSQTNIGMVVTSLVNKGVLEPSETCLVKLNTARRIDVADGHLFAPDCGAVPLGIGTKALMGPSFSTISISTWSSCLLYSTPLSFASFCPFPCLFISVGCTRSTLTPHLPADRAAQASPRSQLCTEVLDQANQEPTFPHAHQRARQLWS